MDIPAKLAFISIFTIESKSWRVWIYNFHKISSVYLPEAAGRGYENVVVDNEQRAGVRANRYNALPAFGLNI